MCLRRRKIVGQFSGYNSKIDWHFHLKNLTYPNLSWAIFLIPLLLGGAELSKLIATYAFPTSLFFGSCLNVQKLASTSLTIGFNIEKK